MGKPRELLAGGVAWSRKSPATQKIKAIGYCAPFVANLFVEEGKDAFQAKYHVEAHDSAEAARACWRNYQLDQMLAFGVELGYKSACLVGGCQNSTEEGARIDFRFFALCPEHQTREIVEGFYEEPDESDN